MRAIVKDGPCTPRLECRMQALSRVRVAAACCSSSPAPRAPRRAAARAAAGPRGRGRGAAGARSTAVAGPAGEPAVQHTVIEDGRARIDELRVRGQLQRIDGSRRAGAPAYEIIVGDGSRDLADEAEHVARRGRQARLERAAVLTRARRLLSMAVYTEVSFDEAAR